VVGHLPVPLAHASAFELGGRLYIAGGSSGPTHTDTVWSIDTNTGVVTPVGKLPGPRSDAAAVVRGGAAWLIGGEASGPAAPLDTVVELRPD